MPLGRGGGAYSVGWEGGKNRETVTASVCLVVTELVALATATPDWSRDNRVHQSAAKWWQLEWQEVAIITSQLRPKWHRFQKNFLDTVLILIVCLLLVHEKIFHLVDPTPRCIFKRILLGEFWQLQPFQKSKIDFRSKSTTSCSFFSLKSLTEILKLTAQRRHASELVGFSTFSCS